MSLSDYKVKTEHIAEYGVVNAPDVMTGSARDNKQIFDRLIREAVMKCLNGLVDGLLAKEAAAELGMVSTGEIVAETVQEGFEKVVAALEKRVLAGGGGVFDGNIDDLKETCGYICDGLSCGGELPFVNCEFLLFTLASANEAAMQIAVSEGGIVRIRRLVTKMSCYFPWDTIFSAEHPQDQETFVAKSAAATYDDLANEYQAGKVLVLEALEFDGMQMPLVEVVDGEKFVFGLARKNAYYCAEVSIHSGVQTHITEIADNNVFIATYDVTTFDELVEAYNAGKAMVLKLNDGSQIQFVRRNEDGNFLFSDNIYATYYNYYRTRAKWGNNKLSLPTKEDMELLENRVTNLEENSGAVPSVDEIVNEVMSALPTWDGGVY